MPEEIFTVVRIPIAEVEESLRAKYNLPKTLTEVRIDGDTLVFSFEGGTSLESVITIPSKISPHRRRRTHRKRNRMKTRGWKVVGRITNSKGQKCAIYQPFVGALSNPNLTTKEQKSIVEKILRSNRNKPSEDSIQYFLGNTLEYIKSKGNLIGD